MFLWEASKLECSILILDVTWKCPFVQWDNLVHLGLPTRGSPVPFVFYDQEKAAFVFFSPVLYVPKCKSATVLGESRFCLGSFALLPCVRPLATHTTPLCVEGESIVAAIPILHALYGACADVNVRTLCMLPTACFFWDLIVWTTFMQQFNTHVLPPPPYALISH